LVVDIAGGKKLRVFENMVLRRIFGHSDGRVNGGMEENA